MYRMYASWGRSVISPPYTLRPRQQLLPAALAAAAAAAEAAAAAAGAAELASAAAAPGSPSAGPTENVDG